VNVGSPDLTPNLRHRLCGYMVRFHPLKKRKKNTSRGAFWNVVEKFLGVGVKKGGREVLKSDKFHPMKETRKGSFWNTVEKFLGIRFEKVSAVI